MDFIRVGAKMAVLLWGAMLVNASAAFTIQDITLLQFKLPKKTAFVTSKGTSDSCPGIFVVIRASDGTRSITSVGEVLPRALVTNETSKDAWKGAQAFRAALLDRTLSGDSLAEDRSTVGKWMNDLFAIAAGQQLTTQSPPARTASFARRCAVTTWPCWTWSGRFMVSRSRRCWEARCARKLRSLPRHSAPIWMVTNSRKGRWH